MCTHNKDNIFMNGTFTYVTMSQSLPQPGGMPHVHLSRHGFEMLREGGAHGPHT